MLCVSALSNVPQMCLDACLMMQGTAAGASLTAQLQAWSWQNLLLRAKQAQLTSASWTPSAWPDLSGVLQVSISVNIQSAYKLNAWSATLAYFGCNTAICFIIGRSCCKQSVLVLDLFRDFIVTASEIALCIVQKGVTAPRQMFEKFSVPAACKHMPRRVCTLTERMIETADSLAASSLEIWL